MQSKNESLVIELAKRLQKKIVEGKLKSGSRLVERDICSQYEVSRSVVREAFIQLSNGGLLENQPRVGVRVSQITEKKIIDAFRLREGIETIAAEQCASRMGREEMEELVFIAKKIQEEYQKRCRGEENSTSYWDHLFHEKVIRGAKNTFLEMSWENIRVHLSRGTKFFPIDSRLHEVKRAVNDDHMEIAEAIAEGDAELAGSKMKSHIKHGRELMVEQFRLKESQNINSIGA